MRKGIFLAAAIMVASPAYAATTITFDEGDGNAQAGEVLLNDFNEASDGAGIASTGTGFLITSADNSQGAPPAFGDQGDSYLSVLGGGSATISFAQLLQQFGFDYGSADTFNELTLLFSDGGDEVYSGQDLIDIGTADGDQGAPRTNGRLTVVADAGRAISGIRLASGSNSFEIDNLAAVSAVPEPATWAFMLMGFGAIGYSMRRRPTYRMAQAV